jgi:hypothetical protein
MSPFLISWWLHNLRSYNQVFVLNSHIFPLWYDLSL